MGNIGASEHSFRKFWTGGGGYSVGFLYPDDTSWRPLNQYGVSAPNTILWRCSKDGRSTGAPWLFEFVGRDDILYEISITYGSGSLPMTWRILPVGMIESINYDKTPEVDSIEIVSVDIHNKGGNGKFAIVLYEGLTELDRVVGINVSTNSTIRATLSYLMLDRQMNMRVDLIDEHNNTVIETQEFVSYADQCEGIVCDPTCFGFDYHNTVCEEGICVQGSLIMPNDPDCGYISPTPDDGTIIDIIMDNKEIIIVGVIVGAVVLKSL